MKKLYEKNELTFSLVWIGAYVILFSIADSISASLGVQKLVTAPLCVFVAAFLLLWIRKNGLMGKYGLEKVKLDLGKYLYFLPLVIIASTNIWGGIDLDLSAVETVLYVISMLCVGLIEEVIFRGFLFKALCKENVKQAILISSLTFGFGHIVNLLNGAELISTLVQICYATAIGFLFTILFHRSGSLVPCIVTHSVVNSLSAIGADRPAVLDTIVVAVLTVIPLAYAIWILKKDVKTKQA